MGSESTAFDILKEYTGPKQIEDYIRRQSKKPNKLDQTSYMRVDLVSNLITIAPSKYDISKVYKNIPFQEIFQIYSELPENVDFWTYSITIEYKTQLKSPLTILFETQTIYQAFQSAFEAIYDLSRNTCLYVGERKQTIRDKQTLNSLSQDSSRSHSIRVMTKQQRADIYKKRNQSYSSSSRYKQYTHEDSAKSCDQTLNIQTTNTHHDKDPKEQILNQYKNHYFGRCLNFNSNKLTIPKSVKSFSGDQMSNSIDRSNLDSREGIEQNKIQAGFLQSARRKFNKISPQSANEKEQKENNEQYYSIQVPNSNTCTDRPQIIIEKQQLNLNNGNSININTPQCSAYSTMTPRHSSISARSRKYKRYKNSDINKQSITINFYDENSIKIQKQDDEKIQKLNKTSITCNYYEPNLEILAIQKNSSLLKNKILEDQPQLNKIDKDNIQTDQQFYPTFTKKSLRKNHQRSATSFEKEPDWSLISINSPKINDTLEKSENEDSKINGILIQPEPKKIKVIRKRNSVMQVDNEQNKNQSIHSQSQNQKDSSFHKISHILTNTSTIKIKEDTKNNQIIDQRIIGSEPQNQNSLKSQSRKGDKSQALQADTITTNGEETQNKTNKQKLNRLDSLNDHKERTKQNQSSEKKQKKQENIQQIQNSVLLPNNSSPQKISKYSSLKSKNSQTQQPSQKLKQQLQSPSSDIDININTKDQKQEYNSYIEKLHEFNQNNLTNDLTKPDKSEHDENNDINKSIINDDQKQDTVISNQMKQTDQIVNNNEIISSNNNIYENQNKEIRQINQSKESNSLNISLDHQNKASQVKHKNYIQERQDSIIQSQNLQNLKEDTVQHQQNEVQNNNKSLLYNDDIQTKKNFEDIFNKKLLSKEDEEIQNQKYINEEKKQIKNNIESESKLLKNTLINQSKISLQSQNIDGESKIQTKDINQSLIEKSPQNQLEVIQYHDFDNSYDVESFSQIRKLDDIINIVEEQSKHILKDQKIEENFKNISNNPINEQKDQEINENQQTIEVDHQLDDSQLSETKNELSNTIKQTSNTDKYNNVNYDWSYLQNINAKPSANPLREKLFISEDEDKSQQQQQNKQNSANQQDNSLMIIIQDKKENSQIKKKELPTLRKRDIFSEEHWNPVTQPKNFKVTYQPPNLNDIKQTKQGLPVKMFEEGEQIQTTTQNQNQKESIAIEEQEINQLQHEKNTNQKSEKYLQNVEQEQNLYENDVNKPVNIFEEVKDFFNQKRNQYNNYDNNNNAYLKNKYYNNNSNQNILTHQKNDILNNQKQNNQNNNCNENNNLNQQNKQLEIEVIKNNYDDWDDDM